MAGIRTHYYASGVMEFEVDTTDDLINLPTLTDNGKNEMSSYGPCAIASSCMILSTAELYKLRSDNTWKVFE